LKDQVVVEVHQKIQLLVRYQEAVAEDQQTTLLLQQMGLLILVAALEAHQAEQTLRIFVC
jgi:hypothetical protein